MTHALRLAALALVALAALPASARAQEARATSGGVVEQVSGFTGQMSMAMASDASEDMAVTEVIRFEPWQMLDELFRDDLVFVMRAGPSDWDAAEAADVGATACDAQRPLSAEGEEAMRQFGSLLVANDLRPGHVVVSEWCRAQQTYAALEAGILAVDANALDGMGAEADPALNLMGAEHGPADVEALRELVMAWDGGDGEGPLLVVTHYPNIEALTEFRAYEGEIIMVDPKRGGRVLGYLRLGSAAPDPVRFDPATVAMVRGAADR